MRRTGRYWWARAYHTGTLTGLLNWGVRRFSEAELGLVAVCDTASYSVSAGGNRGRFPPQPTGFSRRTNRLGAYLPRGLDS